MDLLHYLLLYPFLVFEKARIVLGIPEKLELRFVYTVTRGNLKIYYLERYCPAICAWEGTQITVALERPNLIGGDGDTKYPAICINGTDPMLFEEGIDPGVLAAFPLIALLPVMLPLSMLTNALYRRIESRDKMGRHASRTLYAIRGQMNPEDYETLHQALINACSD